VANSRRILKADKRVPNVTAEASISFQVAPVDIPIAMVNIALSIAFKTIDLIPQTSSLGDSIHEHHRIA
jgi:hypothetical protein